MKIVVCAKQVPMSHRAGMDKTTYTVDRTNSSLMINPVDEHALEVALQIKDLLGAQISVITMGQKQASSLLEYAASLGADELYHINDSVYAGSDTYATSLILSSSIEHIGGADLVVCGNRSFDGETGHLGPQISVKLHMPCITNVIKIDKCTNKEIICTRLVEEERVLVASQLPALITVCEGINHLRLPSILGLRKAKKMAITKITNKDLVIEPNIVGLSGSPTSVKKVKNINIKREYMSLVQDIDKGAIVIVEKLLTIQKNKIDTGVEKNE